MLSVKEIQNRLPTHAKIATLALLCVVGMGFVLYSLSRSSRAKLLTPTEFTKLIMAFTQGMNVFEMYKEQDFQVWQRTFNFYIESYENFCLWKDIEKNTKLYVHTWIINPGHDDVNVELLQPSKSEDLSTNKGHLESTINETGDYGICFENTNFKRSQLIALLTITSEDPSVKERQLAVDYPNVGNLVVRNLARLEQLTSSMHSDLQRFNHFSNIKMHSAVSVSTSVQRWSILFTLVLVCCASVQVFVIKRMFITKKGLGA